MKPGKNYITLRYFTTACYILFFILFTSEFSRAQTCTGSLGDPVVNITFGAGPAASSPLPPGVTSYTYTTNPCPGDGFYNIGSRSPGCFSNTWHSVTQDHTPNDSDGNMMFVNASVEPGDFYTQKVTGLCGGTTYEFSAWILNFLKASSCNGTGIDPNITFTIENSSGVELQSYNTQAIAETPNPQWKPFGFYFKTPPGVEEVIIRMTNNSEGGCGNDLALDDITFRACGPTVMTQSQVSSATKKLCEGEKGTILLDAQISEGYTTPMFQWQIDRNDEQGWKDIVGAKQKSYTVNIPVVNKEGYQFRLAVAEGLNINLPNCRVYSDVFLAEVSKSPTVDAGKDLVMIEGKSVTLNGSAEGDSFIYFWTPSSFLDNPNILNPVASPTEDIIYTLNVISSDSCNNSAMDQVFIRVLKKLVVPNTFTPNADLVNDYWEIEALDSYPQAQIKVFNRYGQTVFKSQGYAQQWDGIFKGNPLPAGIYYYVIDLKIDGKIFKGSVSIIR